MSSIEKDTSSETEKAEDILHLEVARADVPPELIHEEALIINQAKARELQEELARSRQPGYVPITEEEKRASRSLNRKLDIFVIPFLTIIYLFNGLDRSNLGNAATDNFTQDLGMPVNAVNTATTLFFATFVPLQPIQAGLGKRIGQTYFLSIISTLWGILTLSQAFIKTYQQLLAIRLLIGVCEAGFYPTAVSYLTTFYPRYDVASRIALFYGAYAVAGAFGGLIAYGCFTMQAALYGWQYLFIIEGACTIAAALIVPLWLPKSPGRAWFLTPEERLYADKRMIIDSPANFEGTYKVSRKDIFEALTEWRFWMLIPFNIAGSIAPNSFSVFFPLIVKGLGYSGALANLMTVPPYVIGSIFLYLFAWSSDHFHERTGHILVGLFIIMVGLIITITLPLANIHGRYGGCVVLLAGTFIPAPITTAWLAGNTPEPGKRTLIMGMNGFGNVAGIIGSNLYLATYGPTYEFPLKVSLGLVAVSFVGYAGNAVVLRLVNRWRAKKVAAMTPEEVEEEVKGNARYADRKRTFVYGV